MTNTENIRNMCMLAHSNAGKTSLVEAMLHKAGVIDRIGNTEDGNTISDFDAEEIKRKISLNTSLIPVEWNGVKINLLDTPGTPDFIGEQLEGASVCGSALIVVSGKSGVSAGTEKAWNIAKTKAKIVFVNKLEDPKADYAKVVEELNDAFGRSIAPFTFPIKEGDKLTGFVDVIKMRAKMFSPDGDTHKYEEVPAAFKEIAERSRDLLLEAVAEVSEELMEKYFAGEEFTEEEIKAALKIGIKEIKQTKNFIEVILTKELTNKINGEYLFYETTKLSKMFRFKMKYERLSITLDTIKLDKHFIYYLIDLMRIVEKSLE